MKKIKEPIEVMNGLIFLLNKNHQPKALTLGFDFTDINLKCWVDFNNESICLTEGLNSEVDAFLQCRFPDWLKLASGRMKPVWGILTRKLRFKGKATLFRQMSPKTGNEIPFNDQSTRIVIKSPEKIVVLNASPRKTRGYTDLLARALVAGMESVNNNNVKYLHLEDYKFNSCTGCWSCWQKSDGDCIFKNKDGHEELAAILDDADLIVYAFPLYADGMPGKLKNYFDRHVSSLFPYMMKGEHSVCHPVRRKNENQTLAILSLCGFPEIRHFEAVKQHFRALAHNDHRKVVAELVRPAIMYMFNNPMLTDLQGELLDNIYRAGVELSVNGFVSKDLEKNISKPVCTESEFISFANQYWQSRIDEKGGSDY